MWKCECGCVDRIERKYKRHVRDPHAKIPEEEKEEIEVTWRFRQAMPLQSLGKAQMYHVWVICAECQMVWDGFLTSQPLWRELMASENKVRRLEIEGYGASLKPEWEEARADHLEIQGKLRDLARMWAGKRKAEVAAANTAAGVEVSIW